MRENTEAPSRGGGTRSSGEAPVIGVEQRGSVIQLESRVNFERRMSL